jgi:hypothetical protein
VAGWITVSARSRAQPPAREANRGNMCRSYSSFTSV